MKRKILLLLMILALFVFVGFQLCSPKETWLRIEQSGLCFKPDYLHTLAEKDRPELVAYLGNYISFELPLDLILNNVKLAAFGEIEKLMVFKPEDGKCFMVDCSRLDVSAFKTGDILYVKGKLTAASPDAVFILNAYGCPGWPNDITIKTMSQN